MPEENYHWECINGHEFNCPDPYQLEVPLYDEEGEPLEDNPSIVVCPLCYLDWVKAHVPTLKKVEEHYND